MAKNLVMQGSQTAMMSPTLERDPDAAVNLLEQRFADSIAPECGGLRRGVAALCGLGVAVAALAFWLSPGREALDATRGDLVGVWVLQVLITGNLAVGLLWVWLDWLAWRRDLRPLETRGKLALVALVVTAGLTLVCFFLAEAHLHNEVFGIALILAFPTVAVVLPLLWLAVRRIKSVRLGTLILVGFVAASALAQGHIDDSPGTNGENPFVMNSHLVGLAVVVWLLSWATEPHAGRTV
jgi:hypothetical protein